MSERSNDPTPYADLNDVLATFLDAVRTELDANFLGLYLQGSFATGGFDEYSDCDWIVVTNEPVSTDHVPRLQRMHEWIFDLASPWAQHLEGSYFPRAALRCYVPDAEPLLYLDNGSRELVRSNHCDTCVVRWTLREHGVTLAGPDPRTLVDAIEPDAIKHHVRAIMETWSASLVGDPSPMEPRWYQAFTVVAHCRFAHTLATGVAAPKPVAVSWARDVLDGRWRPLIDRTVAARASVHADPHGRADPAELLETAAFVRYVLERQS